MRGCLSNRAGNALAALSAVSALCAGPVFRIHAQQQTHDKAPLVFEVASVKPTPPDERRGIVHQPPGNQSYEAIGAPLRMIMTVAYTVTDRQISGGPDWVNTERWNIEAKAERRGTSDELHDALARLLEERFALKIRRETRDLPAYLLTVDKNGSKMPLHDPTDLKHEPIAGRFQNGELSLTGQNVMMNYFAFFLSRALPLNVVDKTGLSDHYDVALHYVPELPAGARVNGDAPPPQPDGPDIFTALREQLGLRLEKGRGPVEYLVIERVERPSEN
ncbi:MAG TPA: TIGR03435 family protein [Candidatus Acidoferrales bacterium]|nr:TIGR03435 family protein [Candidatus Acidoferrales bacterium]